MMAGLSGLLGVWGEGMFEVLEVVKMDYFMSLYLVPSLLKIKNQTYLHPIYH